MIWGGRAAFRQGKLVSGKLGDCRASLGQPLHKHLGLRDTFCCGRISLRMQGGGPWLLQASRCARLGGPMYISMNTSGIALEKATLARHVAPFPMPSIGEEAGVV